jgi:predicted TIM-barrel fold metal-dependent hydrolase
MAHQIISADCHLDPEFLPKDAFTIGVSKQWQDAVPRVVETPEGPSWFAGDVLLGPSGPRRIKQFLSMGRRGTLMQAAGFDPDQLRPGVPAYRIEDQDRDGVDAELMYGPLRRWRYLSHIEPALAAVIASAYNEFMAAFCATNPSRLYGLGAVPPTDPASMVKELEHIATLGLAGAEVSLADPEHPIFDKHWDPVWSAAVTNDVPIHIHVQDASRGMPGPDSALVERAAFICGIPLGLQPILTTVLLSGILERHPKLKMVFAESGTGWIPYLLDRIDYEWENSHSEWSAICKTKPSELFRRQMYATFQEDAIGPQLAHLYPSNFLWGSDYPHADGIWPDSHEIIKRTMGNLDESLRQRIIHDNAVELYKIGSN